MAIEGSTPMIQTCPACGTAIDTAHAEPLARLACLKCGEKMRVQRTFDHFVVLETLGVGGMGTVYKARDTLLDRSVALKLLRKDLSGEKNTPFDCNRRHASRPREPSQCNSGLLLRNDHGQFYIVMELVEHGSLDDLTAQRSACRKSKCLSPAFRSQKGCGRRIGKVLFIRT